MALWIELGGSMKKHQILLIFSLVFLTGCSTDKQLSEKLSGIVEENPEILIKAIEKNPRKFVAAFKRAIAASQKELAKIRKEEESKTLEGHFRNPLKPKIRNDVSYRGNPNAPIIIVEFLDFQCPFCVKSARELKVLQNTLKNEIKIVYKHLPLSFHPQALITSKYFEAIRLQNPQKAFKFHDMVFSSQGKIKKGEVYLDKLAKRIGVNIARLKKDVKSKKVETRIQEDILEARRLGFQGTPGFLINGIPIKGAYPSSHFVQIIDELKRRKKLSYKTSQLGR